MRTGYEYFSEIIDNLKRSHLRTSLTGFAVMWGITFLVILLSIGVGLSHGILKGVNAGDTEPNYGMYFEVWMTDLPYQDYPAGRWLYLDESQLAQLQEIVLAIKDIASCLRPWNKIGYVSQVVEGVVKGIGANYSGRFGTRVRMLTGRDINGNDVHDREKALLISSSDALKLFDTDRYSEAVDKSVSIDNASFTVMGVYKASQNQSASYAPSSTFTMIHPNDQCIDGGYIYVSTIQNRKDFKAFSKGLLKALSSILSFSPDDDQVMWSYSDYVSNKQYNKVVNCFYLFLWIVGLSTFLTGIVGVSNIILVTVRERYREIGIRKALGAKSHDILVMVMVGSLSITAATGTIDLIIAVGFAALDDHLVIAYHIGEMSIMGETIHLFDMSALLSQTTLGVPVAMIIAGVMVSYTPARRATRISAIEAMRDQ